MFTWDDLKDHFQQFAGIEASSVDDTLGQELMNFKYHELVKKGPYAFTEQVKDYTSVADQYQYTLSPQFGKLKEVMWVDGTTETPLTEVTSWNEWNRRRTSVATAKPSHYMIVKGNSGPTQWQLWLHPTPSESSKTIRVTASRRVKDLSASDYTTGTVTVTAASTTITGSGTTFTAAMAGRAIKLPDGYWYDIASFTSTTVITLASAYEGATAAAQTFIVGDVPLIPEEYQMGIVHGALAEWWPKKRQQEDAAYHNALYNVVIGAIEGDQKDKSTQQIMRDDDEPGGVIGHAGIVTV